MTRVTVRVIVWNKYNVKHIRRHNVTKSEVINAIKNTPVHQRGYNNRYILIGRSGKRILSIIVRREKANTYFVVTARDSDKKERRKLYEKEQKNNS